ncbi:MAG: hypothetical protein CMJ81_02020 [Planctomycetaceae bacterium]|nr:hypothetical protein [Planctomycetaceae bacterium]
MPVGRHATDFRLDEGQIETAVKQARNLLLKLRINNQPYYDEFDVTLNGHSLAGETESTRAIFIMNNQSWVTYPVKKGQLAAGGNEFVFQVRKLNPSISVPPQLIGLEVIDESPRR